MIHDNELCTNVWLGEGDIGLGVVVGQDGQACGIGFYPLKGKHEVGGTITAEDRAEGSKGINILFTNQEGIKSLYAVLERFAKKLIEENGEEEK